MRTFAATVVALGVLAFAADASAFCRSTTCRSTGGKECATDADSCPMEGAPLYWPTSCINFSLNDQGTQVLDPEETFAVLRKTFQVWTEVTCPGGGVSSLTFEERGPVTCHQSEYNKEGHNLNVVLFQDNDWKYRGIDATLAKTSVTYNDETGEIYDADIEINTANNDMTITDPPKKVEYDLQSIITHEVGHFIGIAHSSQASAVMAPTYSPGSIALRKLSPDDVEAVCTIYPPKSGVACTPEPRGGFSDSCGNAEVKKGICSVSSAPAEAGSSAPAASFAVVGLGVLAAARRARRSHRLGRRS
jgi:hypothetical protein